MAVKSKDFLSFNDGVVKINRVTNIAQAGDKPVEGLTLKCKARYREQTVGVSRYYEAKQAHVEITMLISIPDISTAQISSQDIAIINDKQYKIAQLQRKPDTLPPSLLLSLSKIEEVYEIAE